MTLVAASGNSHTDLDNPTYDAFSPDFPPGNEYIRDNITNDCLDIPTEGAFVMSINSVGPSGRKSYFSNYSTDESTVAAPGGDRRDFFGTDLYNTPGTRILSSYPAELAKAEGLINGELQGPKDPLAVVDCIGKRSSQGQLRRLRLPAGDVDGVASRGGRRGVDRERVRHGRGAGFGLAPDVVEQILRETATDHACPR